MHRPELIDGGRVSSASASLNEHSIGSIVSLNTLLASGGIGRNSATVSGRSTNPALSSSASTTTSLDGMSSVHGLGSGADGSSTGLDGAQAYNASFQGLSATSSPLSNQAFEPSSNGNDGEILRMLNSSGSPSQSHSSDMSNVFHFWRSFLDPSSAPLRGGAHGGQAETRSMPRNPLKHSRVEEAKKKHVYQLDCAKCESMVSDRAMRSKLLADANCTLFSTDSPMR